jgi:threonine aldolase
MRRGCCNQGRVVLDPGATLAAPVEANEVFLELPDAAIDGLIADGFLFYRRSPRLVRLVCRFDGEEKDVGVFVTAVARHLEQQRK